MPRASASLAALVVGSVALSAQPARSAIERAVDLARQAGVPVVFDVNLRPTLWSDLSQRTPGMRGGCPTQHARQTEPRRRERSLWSDRRPQKPRSRPSCLWVRARWCSPTGSEAAGSAPVRRPRSCLPFASRRLSRRAPETRSPRRSSRGRSPPDGLPSPSKMCDMPRPRARWRRRDRGHGMGCRIERSSTRFLLVSEISAADDGAVSSPRATVASSVMPSPSDPIAFSIFGLDVRWYALFMLAGVVAGLLLARFLAGRIGLDPDWVLDAAPWVVLFSIVGARSIMSRCAQTTSLSHPVEAINIRLGGLSFHGALIAGTIAFAVLCRRARQPFFWWTDAVVPGVALAQAIGRWGNWANQEAFGTPTTAPWGLWIDPDRRPAAVRRRRAVSPHLPLRVAVQSGERGGAVLGRAARYRHPRGFATVTCWPSI